MPSTATNRLQGLTTSVALKPAVRTVTTANITLSGLQTINGVALAENDRVLVKDQTTQSQNGIYLASTGSWTRALDFDGELDVVRGTLVTSNNDTSIYYRVTTADPITIGTSSITFEIVSGAVTQSSIGLSLYPRTTAEIAAGVTPVNFHEKPGNILRHGTNTDPGTTDMRAAFFNANAGSNSLFVASGNYRIASNLTITKSIEFEQGAILVPDAGVTITINAPISAGPYQIFSTAAFGSLIRGTMCGLVYVNWWGAVDDDSSDNGDEIRAAAAAVAARASTASGLGGGNVLTFPYTSTGVYRYSGTLYYYGSNVTWDFGSAGTTLRKTDTGTAVSASPTTHTVGQYTYYTKCKWINGLLYSESASIGIDFSGFAYSSFKGFEIVVKGNNRKCLYGAGNQGAAPYYNTFDDYALFGDNDGSTTTGSVGISMEEGAWTGGSAGPNANIFSNQRRAAALDYMVDLRAGNGNLFTNISGESISEDYFRLNHRSADDSGTSSGSNTAATINDTGKTWTVNQWAGATVVITGGTGSGQAQRIGSNTATAITLVYSWKTVPDNTSTYEIYKSAAHSNKFMNIRAEGNSGGNPNFINAKYGTKATSFKQYTVESLGSGAIVVDAQKDPSNNLWDGDLIAIPFVIGGVGAGATVEFPPELGSAYYRGGYSIPGQFVVESVSISCEGRTAGTATVTVTVGNTGGTGYTLAGIINADNPDYVVVPGNNTLLNAEANKISVSVTSDGSWAPTTGDIGVIVMARLVR